MMFSEGDRVSIPHENDLLRISGTVTAVDVTNISKIDGQPHWVAAGYVVDPMGYERKKRYVPADKVQPATGVAR